MAYLARAGDASPANLKRAMVFGATMGSFAVEDFSINRLASLTSEDVNARARAFRELVHFDVETETVGRQAR
jgi:hypothetical protein